MASESEGCICPVSVSAKPKMTYTGLAAGPWAVFLSVHGPASGSVVRHGRWRLRWIPRKCRQREHENTYSRAETAGYLPVHVCGRGIALGAKNRGRKKCRCFFRATSMKHTQASQNHFWKRNADFITPTEPLPPRIFWQPANTY